jgi:nucleoside-diphosphate-sugar epimerase
MANIHRIFVTGSTGYIGSRLIAALYTQGHEVIALAREQSTGKLPAGCRPVVGNALDGESYVRFVEGADSAIAGKVICTWESPDIPNRNAEARYTAPVHWSKHTSTLIFTNSRQVFWYSCRAC